MTAPPPQIFNLKLPDFSYHRIAPILTFGSSGVWLSANDNLTIPEPVAPVIRPFAPHEWPTYKDLRLHALAESPEAFGSTLAAEQGRADAEWASRLARAAESGSDLPLVALLDGEPIGLAWGRIEKTNPDVAALYQMWVAPDQRGVGAGRMLLEAVIAWARDCGASFLELGVTVRESPAMHLYRDAGFEPAGELQPLQPGSQWLLQPMRLRIKR